METKFKDRTFRSASGHFFSSEPVNLIFAQSSAGRMLTPTYNRGDKFLRTGAWALVLQGGLTGLEGAIFRPCRYFGCPCSFFSASCHYFSGPCSCFSPSCYYFSASCSCFSASCSLFQRPGRFFCPPGWTGRPENLTGRPERITGRFGLSTGRIKNGTGHSGFRTGTGTDPDFSGRSATWPPGRLKSGFQPAQQIVLSAPEVRSGPARSLNPATKASSPASQGSDSL